jgi:seryl-tRNA(Sec) selenium transferase
MHQMPVNFPFTADEETNRFIDLARTLGLMLFVDAAGYVCILLSAHYWKETIMAQFKAKGVEVAVVPHPGFLIRYRIYPVTKEGG